MRKERRSLTDKEKAWANNLKREWFAKKNAEKITQTQAANEFGWTQGAIGQYINGKIPLNTDAKRKFARFLGVSVTRIDPELSDLSSTGGENPPGVSEELASYFMHIPYLRMARGRGNGSTVYVPDTDVSKGYVIKEKPFFDHFGVNLENLVAVFAKGDAMADFIVNGDLVIFDTSKTEPRSGRIFLINHPDGLKIKELRQEISGDWVIESRNSHGRQSEKISSDMLDRVDIIGEFVYRQCGY